MRESGGTGPLQAKVARRRHPRPPCLPVLAACSPACRARALSVGREDEPRTLRASRLCCLRTARATPQ
eukprot:592421-Alexandrium_andersonii.AAC.1